MRLNDLSRRAALFGGLAGTLGGCSPADLLNAAAPSRLAARNIPFGPDPRQRLDVYAPPGEPAGAPVLVFLYGGGWKDGRKEIYRFLGGAYADAGYVVVVPDYRLYPGVRYPAFLEDCAAGCAWARAHAAEYGGDARQLFLMGHSAGAYNAAMLALDERWLAGAGMSRRDLAGWLGLAGPYDFLPMGEDIEPIFAGADPAGTQPINYVDASAPPAMLATGLADKVVKPGNTKRLAARIRTVRRTVMEHEYRGIGHEELIGAVALPLRFLAPVFRDSLDFMRGRTSG
jgi:acetyl esterase/lipase